MVMTYPQLLLGQGSSKWEDGPNRKTARTETACMSEIVESGLPLDSGPSHNNCSWIGDSNLITDDSFICASF